MSYDFKITNKVCDHILRGISCFISDIDGMTLVPRNDPSQYIFSDPIQSSNAELKLYNQASHTWEVIPKDHPEYGWSISVFPLIEGFPDMGTAVMARFKKRQQSLQKVWRLSYQVTANSCIKCKAARVITDIELVGDPERAYYVQYEAKLAQDFLKFLLTPKGSDPYYTWIGTSLADLPGTKLDMRDLEHTLLEQVQDTANTIKSLQTQQSRISSQQVSGREMLSAVTLVKVQQDTNDPRQILLKIELMTNSRTLTNLQIPVSRG